MDKVELRVAFKAPKTIGDLFPFKDTIKDKYMQSNVVYKIKCKTCNLEYIGETRRILLHRIKNHNNPNENTAVSFHKKQHPDHEIDTFNIEIKR